ncbi:MAG: thermonuclease family protein, partial [Myxococcota bacterium]
MEIAWESLRPLWSTLLEQRDPYAVLAIVLIAATTLASLRFAYKHGKKKGFSQATESFERARPGRVRLADGTRCKVVRVVDGDTFIARVKRGPEMKVRVLGLDTPESRANEKSKRDAERTKTSVAHQNALGKAATARAERMLLNRWVTLEAKKKGAKIGLDPYARYLAYVRLPNGKDYGEEL